MCFLRAHFRKLRTATPSWKGAGLPVRTVPGWRGGSRAPMSGPGKGLQGPLTLQALASPAGGLANYSSSSPTVPAPPLNKFSKEASIGPTAAGCMVLPTNLRSSVSVHMESRGR